MISLLMYSWCVHVAGNVLNPIRMAASGHNIYNFTRDLSQWLSITKCHTEHSLNTVYRGK